ncbi:MAG: NHL repeat-containing protein, partial [Acidobacteriaceae bacterium]
SPKALAFDDSGKLYAANFGNNTVEVFAADGMDLGVFAQVNRPTGLVFDAAGNLYVSNFGNTIERFGPSGSSLGVFASTGLNNPTGMVFDGSGILYVANSGSNTIKKFSSGGREIGTLNSAGLSGPIGLVMDAAGDLYTSNSQTATIQKISPNGTSTIFTTTGASPAFLAMQSAPSLVNISTRLRILPGDGVLVGGFIISGAGTKRVLIRGLGPSLASAGLTGTLADPALELHGGPANAVLAKNDNWQLTQPIAIAATGLQPTNPAEAAMIVTLSEGAYSVIESGNNGTSGVGLVEIYDLTAGIGPVLVNISTRGYVDTGSNVMIAGFIVAAQAGGDSTVLVRGLGPSLGAAGVANPLANPVLDLHDSNGALVASNDNWQAAQSTEIEATGLAPTKTMEAAILATLAPGAYTAIESGKNGGTGVGLVEVYNLR